MNRRAIEKWIALILLLTVAWCTSASMRDLVCLRRIDAATLHAMPLIRQNEYKDKVVTVGGVGKSVHTSGCGAVCVAMAAGYLRGRTAPSPEALFVWAYEHGYYTGNGIGHPGMTAMASAQGLKSRWIGADAGWVRLCLLQGYPVIAHVGPGTFTKNGHYILLRGIDSDGNILVNDPGSLDRSQKSYPLDLIFSELRTRESIMLTWV